MCNVQPEDDDYRREVQRETAQAQGRYPAPYRHHDRVYHRAHSIVYYLEEAVRRVSGEPAEQDPGYYKPEQYVECVVGHLREQQAHLKPKRLQEEGELRLRHHLANLRACSVAASTPS